MRKKKALPLHRYFIRSYKKNTLAIYLSFVLTFLLLTAMVVLIHTNHRIANIQDKTIVTPSDGYIRDLTEKQMSQLKHDPDILHLAVQQGEYKTLKRNNQDLYYLKGDQEYITMNAAIVDGRYPENQKEVAAERWVLLNLGIEPKCGQKFQLKDSESGKNITLELVGILSDMSANKQYGTLHLYAGMSKERNANYIAYVKLRSHVEYSSKMKELRKKLGVHKKQIKICPGKENYKELYCVDAEIIAVIVLVCMVVFYGIFRITLVTRQKQYGILRAIGMKRWQLQRMILFELYGIYLPSVPVGIAAGLLISLFIVKLSGDGDTVLVGIVGYTAGRRVVHLTPMEAIAGVQDEGKKRKSIFKIKKIKSKSGTLFSLGMKYMFRDKKTSLLVVLTICLGVTLFTGLAYRSKTLKTYREDTKEMWYLNGQYEMSMRSLESAKQGVSRENEAKVLRLEDVTSIKTASGIPIRVVDEQSVKRNDKYYNEINETMKKYNLYEFVGHDGTNQIYKSILYGYNESALNELEKYVIAGKRNLQNLKEDEIILSILRMDDTKKDGRPGSYREGSPLMEYKVGDSIQMKYRKDFHTDCEEYETLKDSDAEYEYKTYKVAAIVSFEYMYDCNRTVYPILITKDSAVKKICPESCYQCMYINGKPHMTAKEQTELEQELIKIGSQNTNISTRSLISEIRQNEMFYRKQLVYVYGIAIVSFLLVLIQIINNLRYRMQTRTREICMLRAVGMSVAMTKRMMLFENEMLGFVSIALACIISQPVLRYVYKISDMKSMGHRFHFDYEGFLIVSVVTLIICGLLSMKILSTWKSRSILEEQGRAE